MKLIKKALYASLVLVACYGIWYLWRAFPIITGYSAKILCSCTFVAGRDPENVLKNELGNPPLSLASSNIHYDDSSANTSVWGLSQKKAVYRKALC